MQEVYETELTVRFGDDAVGTMFYVGNTADEAMQQANDHVSKLVKTSQVVNYPSFQVLSHETRTMRVL